MNNIKWIVIVVGMHILILFPFLLATHAYTAQPVSTATTELPVTDCNITHNTKLNNNTVPDFGLSAQPQRSHSLKMALNHIILILSLTMSFNTN